MNNLLELREKLMQDKADLDKRKWGKWERVLESLLRKIKEERETLLEIRRENHDIKKLPLLIKTNSCLGGVAPLFYLENYFYDFVRK